MPDIRIRSATEADVPSVYEIWRAAAHQDDGPGWRETMLPLYRHELATGHLWVADRGGDLAGYAALFVRGGIAFLADLFVAPGLQSQGVGGALLRSALATPAASYCTMSSRDPRALTLYARAGMRPRWPHFVLSSTSPIWTHLRDDGVTIAVADYGDLEFVAWDARVGGRERPEDHVYWQRVLGAVPLWCRRRGTTLGYGYVWRRPPERGGGPEVRIGPLGVAQGADALPCLGAILRWLVGEAAVRGQEPPRDPATYCVAVPGPHPALGPLLRAGFRIRAVETFCCSHGALFFDPETYLAPTGPEGTSLF